MFILYENSEKKQLLTLQHYSISSAAIQQQRKQVSKCLLLKFIDKVTQLPKQIQPQLQLYVYQSNLSLCPSYLSVNVSRFPEYSARLVVGTFPNPNAFFPFTFPKTVVLHLLKDLKKSILEQNFKNQDLEKTRRSYFLSL